MEIVDLAATGKRGFNRATKLLLKEFAETIPSIWPTKQAAEEAVRAALATGSALAAIDAKGQVVGWCAAQPHYNGCVWRVRPVVVDSAFQGIGIGTMLLRHLEMRANMAGVLTLWASSDDEMALTPFSNVNLYADLPSRFARVHEMRAHPLGFYVAYGFTIVGVLPDAYGKGKPDIFLAKRAVIVPPEHDDGA